MRTIYGPPGCGKTTRLAAIVAEKIAEGKSVTVCSYTKTAAMEIAKRAGKNPSVSTGTIHSICFRAAGLHRDMVMSNTDIRKVCSLIGVEYTGKDLECDTRGVGDDYLAIQQKAAASGDDEMVTYSRSDKPGNPAQFKLFCEVYSDYKREFGLIDFSDMVWKGIEAIDAASTDVLIVDEAQDLSPLQWRFVDSFRASEKYVAGDDDQSLFVWAGADCHRMLTSTNFEVLHQSYRVPISVHRVAEKIARRILNRKEKEYLPRPEVGVCRVSTIQDSLKDAKHGDDLMVLYRINKQCGAIEGMLIDRYLPWSGGDSILESRWAAGARAWENLRRAYEKNSSITIGDKLTNILSRVLTPKAALALARSDNSIMSKKWWEVITVPIVAMRYLMAIEKRYGLDVVPTIQLSTIHAAKGREADRVILINSLGNDKVADGFRRDPDSEYRVFYVGVTRAKARLDIIIGDQPLPF
jgi:superfamily I DNA/RNA helicase